MARAYMYRGALFTQMGDMARARTDHAQLLWLDPESAARLERIIAGADGRDEYDDLAGASEGVEHPKRLFPLGRPAAVARIFSGYPAPAA